MGRYLLLGVGIVSVLTVKPAHVRQISLHMATRGNQLGGDGDRDLFRGNCSDIEADGGMYTIEQIGSKTLFWSSRKIVMVLRFDPIMPIYRAVDCTAQRSTRISSRWPRVTMTR